MVVRRDHFRGTIPFFSFSGNIVIEWVYTYVMGTIWGLRSLLKRHWCAQQKIDGNAIQNLKPPFLFAALDEISLAAVDVDQADEFGWLARREAPGFTLSDIMGWIQYNLPNIIRRYTRGSRRPWQEGDDNLIREKLRQGEIKYALVLNVCRPLRAAPFTEHHYWPHGNTHPAGASFIDGEPVVRRAPKTLLQKLRGIDWKKFADGHDEALKDRRLRGGHRRTNRLRRTRRRHKKAKRPRRRRRRRKTRRRR